MSDRFLMDGHKLYWHLDRVTEWLRGDRISPIHIDAGLSKGCNIRCSYCFGVMQGNVYEEGLESCFPREPLLRYMRDAGALGVRSIAFVGEAEPLVNPHAYEAIVCGKKSGVDMALGTNGTLFDTGKQGEEALEHLSWLRFNLSAASPDAYLRVHGRDLFAQVLEKIRFCVAVKRRKGLDVTIGLQMVLMPSNVDQAVPLAVLGRDLGVDYLVIKQCSDSVDNTLGVFNRLGEYDQFADRLKEAESVSTGSYSVIVKWRKVTNQGARAYEQCLGTPFLLYSSGNGKLYPCGMFFNHREEEFCMGDLVEHSFREILESDRYSGVVDKIRNLDLGGCYVNCRTDAINDFLWRINHPPEHVNFI
ncbi:radical SAM/SPASM domain-containing protein [Geobacter sp. OR-1]|uniref:radical SAM/SPASM domain-containing protein n=1 Tax=Geobacter sp. OR-1 TaxID=1266765 RepID=UPI0005AA2F23|nr:radical SAM protein [Geobacter sp. OR-1]